ncbi:condensation domain-containing protein [Streptomyces sp. NPDC056347]|uniref:condensation domain-containing protein n=1 Tax=Streptomyces sp. NPDC056347 TaxID=3345790 RepID=UPI0035DEFC2A
MTTTTHQTLPLTAVQETMWTAYRVAPHSAAYNIVMPLLLRGPLDPHAMARAVTTVADRQELLRSAFTEQDGRPVRTPCPHPPVTLETHDLDTTDDTTLRHAVHEAGARPFHLETSAFRVVLLRRSDTEWALVTAAHHIVSDFTSRWLLVRDLLDAYTAHTTNTPPAWRPLTATYTDHTTEEHRHTASESGQRAADRWRTSLHHAPAAQLPLDRPRPAVRSLKGGTVTRTLDTTTAQNLDTAAATAHVTPFAYLLGVFQALTHRWSGQDEFVLGVPATSRMGKAHRDIIGCYLNTMPVHARFTPASTFTTTAQQAGENVMQGMINIRYPCALAFPQATVFRTALFLVQMDRMDPPVPNVPPGHTTGPSIPYKGLDIALIDVPQQEGQLDLLLRIEQTPHDITTVFSYDTDILDRTTVERLADGYERMLTAAVTDPDTPVTAVELATADETAALLALGTTTSDDFDDFDDFASFENSWEPR